MDFRQFIREHPTMGPWYARTQGRPSWVVRGALTAAVLVIVVPLVLLTLAAVAVGAIVFVVLSLAARVTGLFGGRTSGHASTNAPDGRQNVRVIQR